MEYVEAEYPWSLEHCKKLFPNGYFEFRLGYGSRPEYYREFDRFHWTSRKQCARYKNRYTGPVVVDITEWADEEPNTCLTDFLYYLSDTFAPKDCVLISEKQCNKALLDHIEKTVAIQKKLQKLQSTETAKRVIGFTAPEKEEREHV